jgi:FixJ family two-component response regulator
MTVRRRRPRPLVHVVEDSATLRETLLVLLEEAGLRVRPYDSAEDFLHRFTAAHPACLLLDVGLPGMSGLELQDELRARGITVPIVFMTATPTESARRRALSKGAVDFVEKTATLAALLEPVQRAIALDASQRRKRRPKAR